MRAASQLPPPLLSVPVIGILSQGRSDPARPPEVPDWNSHVYEPPRIELSQQPWSAERPSLSVEESSVQVAKAPERPSSVERTLPHEAHAPGANPANAYDSIPVGGDIEPRTGEVLSMPLDAPGTARQPETAAHPDPAMGSAPAWNGPSAPPPSNTDRWQDFVPGMDPNAGRSAHEAPPASTSQYPTTDPGTWMFRNDFPESGAHQPRLGRRPEYPAARSGDESAPGARLDGTIAPLRDRLR